MPITQNRRVPDPHALEGSQVLRPRCTVSHTSQRGLGVLGGAMELESIVLGS